MRKTCRQHQILYHFCMYYIAEKNSTTKSQNVEVLLALLQIHQHHTESGSLDFHYQI